jgi:hypothetical protein
VKPIESSSYCKHPIKWNDLLQKKQEVKSELLCPWSCSSGYSDDPEMCQYNQDCLGCSSPVSFPSIDSSCPLSKYGCCADKYTKKTDEFGNNCLTTGASGDTGPPNVEGFETLTQPDPTLNNDQNLYILKTEIPHQMYPACPNIQCPNENAFNVDNQLNQGHDKLLGTMSSWSVITDYTTA